MIFYPKKCQLSKERTNLIYNNAPKKRENGERESNRKSDLEVKREKERGRRKKVG